MTNKKHESFLEYLADDMRQPKEYLDGIIAMSQTYSGGGDAISQQMEQMANLLQWTISAAEDLYFRYGEDAIDTLEAKIENLEKEMRGINYYSQTITRAIPALEDAIKQFKQADQGARAKVD